MLSSCYRRSLEIADELGARTLAFPAIATGAYGFPPEQAARIAVATIHSTPSDLTRILLIAFDPPTRDHLTTALHAQGE